MTDFQPLKILFYDLETAPLLAHIWHPADDYVTHERLIHDSFIITWSAKWYGDKTMHSGLLTPTEAKDQDDSRIVQDLADLIREADFLVAHNGDRFDIPMLNNRLLVMGLEPMGPKRTIDTCKIAKQSFRLAYNKLDYLGEILGVGKKLKTDFALWKSCYHGDPIALARMLKYNRQDVLLLEKVYDKLIPYGKGIPRLVNPLVANLHACPTCGSQDLMKRGTAHTNAGAYQKYHCQKCLRYCRGRTGSKMKLNVVPL